MNIRNIKVGKYKLNDCQMKIEYDVRYTIITINDKFNFFFNKEGDFEGIGMNKKINKK